MSDAKQRLTRLIELATKDQPESRRALATELCDLLSDWPSAYPAQMREPFEALLEKTLHRIDGDTRRALAEKMAQTETAPLAILNEVYFDAAPETRNAILLRNALLDGAIHSATPMTDEAALVHAARARGSAGFADAFADLLGIGPQTARHIIEDRSGAALAVACKGAHLGRATFSALAVLTEEAAKPDALRDKLESFESIPLTGAERLLEFWRTHKAA